MSELKPCPFCGEREDLQVNDDSDNEGRGGVQYIWCYACNIGGPSAVMPEDVWNARPFEAHAVEVLSQVIWNDYTFYRCTLEESKVKARELLGIKEGE